MTTELPTSPPLPVALEVVRAARSMFYNIPLVERVTDRVQRAEAVLHAYLDTHQLEAVRLGAFEVRRVAGRLTVTKVPPLGAEQLALLEQEMLADLADQNVDAVGG